MQLFTALLVAPTVPVQTSASLELSFSHSPKFGKAKGEKQDPEVGGESSKHVMGEALALTRDPPTCYSTLRRAQLLLKVQVRGRGLCFRGAGGGVRRVGRGWTRDGGLGIC